MNYQEYPELPINLIISVIFVHFDGFLFFCFALIFSLISLPWFFCLERSNKNIHLNGFEEAVQKKNQNVTQIYLLLMKNQLIRYRYRTTYTTSSTTFKTYTNYSIYRTNYKSQKFIKDSKTLLRIWRAFCRFWKEAIYFHSFNFHLWKKYPRKF